MNKRNMMPQIIRVLLCLFVGCLAACQQEEEATISGTPSSENLTADAQQFQTAHMVAPNALFAGKALGYLGASWWQWAYQFPCARNPILDPTGVFQNQGQRGGIFYLAGSSGGTVVRNVTIPRGRFIFFPIINFLNTYPCPDPDFKPAPGQTLADFLSQGAKEAVDFVDELYLELDGYEFSNLNNYRLQSPLFEFRANRDLVTNDCFGDPCLTGTRQQGVTDGYWVLLTPLSRGNHKLRFKGGVSAFGFSLDVTYNIKVQ